MNTQAKVMDPSDSIELQLGWTMALGAGAGIVLLGAWLVLYVSSFVG